MADAQASSQSSEVGARQFRPFRLGSAELRAPAECPNCGNPLRASSRSHPGFPHGQDRLRLIMNFDSQINAMG